MIVPSFNDRLGLAFTVRDTVFDHATVTASFPFSHSSFELVHLSPLRNSFTSSASKKNRLTESAFFSELCDFLEHCNLLGGKALIVGDFNFHFDCPTNSKTVRIMDMLQTFRFCQAVGVPTHRCGHTLDLVVHREEDSLFCSVSVCHSLSSDHLPEMCSLDTLKP